MDKAYVRIILFILMLIAVGLCFTFSVRLPGYFKLLGLVGALTAVYLYLKSIKYKSNEKQ